MNTTSEANISLYKEETAPGWLSRVCTVHYWVVAAMLGIIAAYSIATLPVMWAQTKMLRQLQKMELIMVDAKIATYEEGGKFVVLWKGSHNEQQQ
jgi:hypothetical protein